MEKILILGASGLIGGALLEILKKDGRSVLGTYSKNKEAELLYFNFLNPDFDVLKSLDSHHTVYVMTAYSNPNWISENKAKAEDLNVRTTKAVIDFLSIKMPRLIFMSSVEIFDGVKGCYSENDQSNPLNYYGMMKKNIEDYLEINYSNHCIIRTGWNVGLNEKSRCVVQLTYETLLKPNARMARDNYFSLASVEDTGLVLSRLLEKPNVKKLHICSDEVVCRTDLANIIINKSKLGSRMSFDECLFKDIPYKEPRGRINDLDNSLSKKIFGYEYKSTVEIIEEKVKYLDEI